MASIRGVGDFVCRVNDPMWPCKLQNIFYSEFHLTKPKHKPRRSFLNEFLSQTEWPYKYIYRVSFNIFSF